MKRRMANRPSAAFEAELRWWWGRVMAQTVHRSCRRGRWQSRRFLLLALLRQPLLPAPALRLARGGRDAAAWPRSWRPWPRPGPRRPGRDGHGGAAGRGRPTSGGSGSGSSLANRDGRRPRSRPRAGLPRRSFRGSPSGAPCPLRLGTHFFAPRYLVPRLLAPARHPSLGYASLGVLRACSRYSRPPLHGTPLRTSSDAGPRGPRRRP